MKSYEITFARPITFDEAVALAGRLGFTDANAAAGDQADYPTRKNGSPMQRTKPRSGQCACHSLSLKSILRLVLGANLRWAPLRARGAWGLVIPQVAT